MSRQGLSAPVAYLCLFPIEVTQHGEGGIRAKTSLAHSFTRQARLLTMRHLWKTVWDHPHTKFWWVSQCISLCGRKCGCKFRGGRTAVGKTHREDYEDSPSLWSSSGSLARESFQGSSVELIGCYAQVPLWLSCTRGISLKAIPLYPTILDVTVILF